MRLSESNHRAICGDSKLIEGLCSSCIYRGSTTCPSKKTSFRSMDKYPHVKDYVLDGGLYLQVTECDGYYKKNPVIKKIKKPEYVWNRNERRFEKRFFVK